MTDQVFTGDPGRSELPGLLLMFEQGGRPGRKAVLAALSDIPRAVVRHDPVPAASSHVSDSASLAFPSEGSLEILIDGLAFDLLGLLPGPWIVPPAIEHFVERAPDDLIDCEAVGLFPSPHVAEGANTLPVVRTMLGLAAKLAAKFASVRAICWTPARSAVSPPTFVEAVDVWLRGGQFPAPGLFALRRSADGSIRSNGLAFFVGSEFTIDADLCGADREATDVAASVAHELVGFGMPESAREFSLDDATIVQLEPDHANRMTRVRYARAS
ncbi:hypothetical protein [Qipengyuania qiaonensis]|uniref:DUF4261 domain-containing protein n=1 Tax=Qipengyuania qiaonensis TaxID=2867240 RepID=A0ABS7J246_9SPHN|nr:hypothetical protein [Qipengyuania qiaonensis]MBX7481404.1 hypothetical protein [Qipengyuania qiaonensis]